MSTPRIYMSLPAAAAGSEIVLPQGAFRHLVQVLRMAAGEEFVAFTGEGGEWRARLSEVSRREATATLLGFDEVDRESPLDLALAQCVSKGERMDYTLQKAVEMGVARIIPLLSSRSVVRLDAERWDRKLEHWRGIVISACEQSGRTRLPSLSPVVALPSWLDDEAAPGERLVLDPNGRHAIAELPRPNGPVTLLVGPEGGLTEHELERAHQAGFAGIRIGPRILRTETAGLATLAALQALWGDLR